MIKIDIFNFLTVDLVLSKMVDYFEHGTDLMSDTNMSVEFTEDIYNVINVNDLIKLKEENKEYFYVVTSVEKNKVYFSSFLNIFNDNVKILDTNISLYHLLNITYQNNSDGLRYVQFLDISGVNGSLNIVLPKTETEVTDNIYNIKEIVKWTILGDKFNLSYGNDLNNKRVILSIQPRSNAYSLNLKNDCFYDLELPKVTADTNTVDFFVTESVTKTVTDNEGNDTSVEEVVNEYSETYVLKKDNTVSNNLGDVNRILPPKIQAYSLSYNSSTDSAPNLQEEAESKLLDDSKIYLSFSMSKKRNMYTDNYKIGDIFKIYMGTTPQYLILTALKVAETEESFTFGTKRQDILYNIKRG